MSITIIVSAIVAIVFLLSVYDHNIIPTRTALAQSITDDNGVIMYYYPSSPHSVYNPLILQNMKIQEIVSLSNILSILQIGFWITQEINKKDTILHIRKQ
jgi:hypothetical protein